jgi:DNA-binding transcriptional ArsR family regulator
MNAEQRFVSISSLLCEPVRAKMLWNLLDGRAYTAGELSIVAETSPTSASNHLSKLLQAEIIRVESQGRHRYYSLSSPEVAYAIEGMANLAANSYEKKPEQEPKHPKRSGINYCRTCYDHLAGFVGVQIVEAFETKGYLIKSDKGYLILDKGWQCLALLDIMKTNFSRNTRRPIARQCLDWSERRPHLAGQLGAAFLNQALERKWFRKVQFSRELIITSKGSRELYELLGVTLQ